MALADYLMKRKITIDHNKIDSTLSNYPVMLKLYENDSVSAWDSETTYAVNDIETNDSAYFKCRTASTAKEPRVTASWQDDWQYLGEEFDFSKVRSDAKDIRFTASDESTTLDYERELFDVGNAWVEGYSLGDGSQSKQSDHLYLEAESGASSPYSQCAYVANTKIDLTGIDTLYVEWENTGSDSASNRSRLIVSATKYGDSETHDALKITSNTFAKTTDSLDVSGLSGEYYIRVLAQTSTPSTGTTSIVKVFDIYYGTTHLYDNGTENTAEITPAGESVFHIKIPSISSSADTDYYMFYNYPSESTDGENKTGTWDSNFVFVNHMGLSVLDSTSNDNDGTDYSTELVGGLNGNARRFESSSSRIEIANDATLNADYYTLTFVHKFNAALSSHPRAYPKLIYRRGADSGYAIYYGKTAGQLQHSFGDGSSLYYGTYSITHDETVYTLITATHDGTDGKLYINDSLKETINEGYQSSTLTVGIANNPATQYELLGDIDEVRISNVARSAAWIKADDSNLIAWDLLSVGAAESIKVLSFTISASTSATKGAGKILSFSSSAVVSAGKAVSKSLAHSVSASVSAIRSTSKALLYNTSVGMNAQRAVATSKTFVVSAALQTVKQIAKNIAHNITTSITTSKAFDKALEFAATVSATLSKQVNKLIIAPLTAGVTIARDVAKTITANISSAVSVTRQTAKDYLFTATASVTLTTGFAKVFNFAVTTSMTLAKQVSKTITATVDAAVNTVKQIRKSITQTASAGMNIVRSTGKQILLTGSAGVNMIRAVSKRITQGVTAIAATIKQVDKPLAFLLGVSINALIGHSLRVTLNFAINTSVSLKRHISKAITALATAAMTATKEISRTLTASISAQATTIKQTAKNLTTAISVSIRATAVAAWSNVVQLTAYFYRYGSRIAAYFRQNAQQAATFDSTANKTVTFDEDADLTATFDDTADMED